MKLTDALCVDGDVSRRITERRQSCVDHALHYGRGPQSTSLGLRELALGEKETPPVGRTEDEVQTIFLLAGSGSERTTCAAANTCQTKSSSWTRFEQHKTMNSFGTRRTGWRWCKVAGHQPGGWTTLFRRISQTLVINSGQTLSFRTPSTLRGSGNSGRGLDKSCGTIKKNCWQRNLKDEKDNVDFFMETQLNRTGWLADS